jgi:hypothetical protein
LERHLSDLRCGDFRRTSIKATAADLAAKANAERITLDVVKLFEAKRGFVLRSRRWVEERSIAWMRRFRHLAKDYERLRETLAGLHLPAFACPLFSRAVKLFAESQDAPACRRCS